MGEIIKYNCPCGYSQEFSVGVGMMGMNMMMIQNVFPDDILADFIKEKEKENIETFINKNQLGLCTNCHTLVAVPHLQYTLKDGSEKHIIGSCPDCGKEFSLINNPDDVCCPKCGKIMTSETVGHWD